MPRLVISEATPLALGLLGWVSLLHAMARGRKVSPCSSLLELAHVKPSATHPSCAAPSMEQSTCVYFACKACVHDTNSRALAFSLCAKHACLAQIIERLRSVRVQACMPGTGSRAPRGVQPPGVGGTINQAAVGSNLDTAAAPKAEGGAHASCPHLQEAVCTYRVVRCNKRAA